METVGEGVPGYVTPKVAVGAVVGNDEGEILLVQRADSGIWLYPTGWADIGYSPAEVAVKEVEEETGIHCEPVRLLAVIDGMRMGFTRVAAVLAGVPLPGDRRRAAAPSARDGRRRLVRRDRCPAPCARRRDRWGPAAFAAIRGEPVEVLFDAAARPGLARRRLTLVGRLAGGELREQRLDDRHLTAAASHSSPMRSWSTTPDASGAIPSAAVPAAASGAGSSSSP